MCRFSIIIPVYQAEKYLKECVESILNQTEQDWEMILIDDGSTDRSPEICDSFAEKYSQIRVLHQKNAGPLLTRCKGYEMANGKYILSMDADDRVSEQALYRIGRAVEQTEVDILVFGYKKIKESGKQTAVSHCMQNKLYCDEQKTELFRELWEKNAFNQVWNKVFRKDFIKNNLHIPENLEKIKSGDDSIIVTPLLIQAEKIRTIHDELYEYRIVPGSISRCFVQQKGWDFILSRSYMLEQIQNAGLLTDEVKKDFYMGTYRSMCYIFWQCAGSRGKMEEKRDFFLDMIKQKLYQDSLDYAKDAAFPGRKQLSLWLFKHKRFRNFISYERVQEFIKHINRR